ncbi:hypothetical protein F4777DRAFT_522825 [Nemania sp. FL0916]|nr:hypothetical protein F4777DRAFT_522825 [Nemania sp. FL0916]
MAGSKSSTRSVADATRFTPATPHANTKTTSTSSSNSGRPASGPNARTIPRGGGGVAGRGIGGGGGGAGSATMPKETLEERVRRLRAAHLAAKQHTVSSYDRFIVHSRRFFDAAHKFTVAGLIGFSGLAFLVTIYATADMMIYNRKRRNEFFAVQKQMREDSLEAARLAYMQGTASAEQIAMVEDATAKAKETGIGLPPILSAPRTITNHESGEVTATSTSVPAADNDDDGGTTQQKKGGFTGWLFSGLKKHDDTSAPTSTTTSPSSPSPATAATAAIATATDDVASAVRDKAKAAYEQERDNQRHGGPLDQVGLDSSASRTQEKPKKGWFS